MKEQGIQKKQAVDIVSDWLKKCNKQKVLPWEYDLKQEIYYKINEKDHPVKRFLDARAGNYFSQRYLKIDGEYIDIETEECELMQSIYFLLWGTQTKNSELYKNNNIEADIMNSFFTPYKKRLKAKNLRTWQSVYYEGKKGDYQSSAPGDFQELVSHFEDVGYNEINSEFKDFAKFTHTIGNCTLVPRGFNKNEHRDRNNTWSQVLQKIDSGEVFIKLSGDCSAKNVMNLTLSDYKEKLLMNNFYLNNYGYSDIEYLENVVDDIEKRGKEMVWKLCEELLKNNEEIKEYAFYKELQGDDKFPK